MSWQCMQLQLAICGVQPSSPGGHGEDCHIDTLGIFSDCTTCSQQPVGGQGLKSRQIRYARARTDLCQQFEWPHAQLKSIRRWSFTFSADQVQLRLCHGYFSQPTYVPLCPHAWELGCKGSIGQMDTVFEFYAKHYVKYVEPIEFNPMELRSTIFYKSRTRLVEHSRRNPKFIPLTCTAQFSILDQLKCTKQVQIRVPCKKLRHVWRTHVLRRTNTSPNTMLTQRTPHT